MIKIYRIICSFVQNAPTLALIGSCSHHIAAITLEEIQARLKARDSRAIVPSIPIQVLSKLGVRATSRLAKVFHTLDLLLQDVGALPPWHLYQELSCLVCKTCPNSLRTEGFVDKGDDLIRKDVAATLTFECLGGSKPCHSLYQLSFSATCQRDPSHCQNYLLRNAPPVTGKL